MQHSIEAYFLMNFLLDSALIAVVARANECLAAKRIFFSGMLAALYATLTQHFAPALAHPAVQLVLLIPISLIVCMDPEPRRWGSIAFQLACGSMMLGGIGLLFGDRNVSVFPWRLPILGSGMLLLYLLLSARTRRLTTWEVTVFLRFGSRSISFRALIDTGNRLREPVSGLPVLIAEASLLHGVISEDDASSGREIAFGGLGGTGKIRCFRPDSVLIRRGNALVQAPAVWVAVYPGKIPGNTRALAPPSFAIIPGKT